MNVDRSHFVSSTEALRHADPTSRPHQSVNVWALAWVEPSHDPSSSALPPQYQFLRLTSVSKLEEGRRRERSATSNPPCHVCVSVCVCTHAPTLEQCPLEPFGGWRLTRVMRFPITVLQLPTYLTEELSAAASAASQPLSLIRDFRSRTHSINVASQCTGALPPLFTPTPPPLSPLLSLSLSEA